MMLDVMLSLILLLLALYIMVWIRGPREGTIARKNRLLRHAKNYWQKRPRKKQLVLVPLLALFLISFTNPAPYSMPLAIGNELNENPFFAAADGAESSESITSFSETSADDTLLYPDADSAIGFNELSSSSVLNENETDVIWNDPGPIWWRPYRAGGYSSTGGASNSTMIEMWGYKSTPLGPVEIEVCYYLNTSVVLTNDHLFYIKLMAEVAGNYRIGFYNGSTEHYTASFPIAAETWTIITALDLGNIVTGTVSRITVENDPTASYEAGANHSIWIDYHHLTDIPVVTNADIYAESFADVSDWTNGTMMWYSSDGDVLTIEDSGITWNYIWTDASFTDFTGYVEVRSRVNTTSGSHLIRLFEGDGMTGDFIQTYLTENPASWETDKYLVENADIESICIYYSAGDVGVKHEYDYLRIGSADEMGWAHDGSTTAGVTHTTSANVEFTESSDGDILTMNATMTNAYTYTYRYFLHYDTTATACDLNRDYYPFGELRYRVTQFFGLPLLQLSTSMDGYYATIGLDTDGSWHTLRWNQKAAGTVASTKALSFHAPFDAVGDAFVVEVDWAQYCSIANFTYTGSTLNIFDYMYVDSGRLIVVEDGSGWQQLNHDPALSVDVSVYNIWNQTVASGDEPDAGFSAYVGEWLPSGSTNWWETRGDYGTTGTLTDFRIAFIDDTSYGAIKFIEDGTAPSVLRISATPPEPDDTESVTLSALATDTVEVYKVWFRPITGPTGFSQTDYEATEQTDNLWTYEFSSLDEGYWAFKAIANDGANNSTLDADSVTDFWVREKELIISNTLYTETSIQCTFAGQTNVACDYVIYDDDVEQESGNKAAGSFFLDWNKQTSVGTHNWGIKFYTASDTDWHNGSYEVLTTTLLVTEYGIRTTTNYAYLHGYVNLNANYTVYEETVQVGTGSVSAGSFEIRWTKASLDIENVTVLFESGSQSYPVYSGYDVAAQVTFVVESWWMDLNLGVESYVEFYVLTSYENGTVYAYDNNTLMTTVTESAGGAYSYFWMSESEGLHIITLNITHGATVHTRTRTYYIPDWAATGLVVRWDLWTFQDNYTMLELGSNWMNCTYYVYLNSSLVATSYNDPVTLNFTRSMNNGTYNLTIYADGGTQTYTISNIRYIVTEEGVSYDFSTFSGGVTIVEGDTYEGDVVTIHENPTGVFIDQATAAIVAVGSFLIIFTAFLVARELKQREREKTERTYSQ